MGAPDIVKHPQRIITDLRPALAEQAAEWVAETIAGAVSERGHCTIALSGGTTPRAVYTRLARHHTEVPWPAVDVYFGDERCVPPHHPESNFQMADQLLLRQVPIPRAQIHRMHAEWPDDEAAAREYAEILPDELDVLLLGMGIDGHTASLFPHAPSLDERDRRVVAVDSPVPPPKRLTITPPVISRARRVAVIVAGTEKAPTVERALEGRFDPHALPVQFALGGVWFVDRAAAALLQSVTA
jgi:6-phosphogluconolactonase